MSKRTKSKTQNPNVTLSEVFGARLSKERVAAINSEMERIKAKHGTVTKKLLVDETIALGKKSPIYGEFNWNLKSAAYSHWLEQAGRMIREVQIYIVRAPDVKPKAFRKWVFRSVEKDYSGAIEVVSNEQQRATLMADLERDIERLRQKYHTFVWLAKYLDDLLMTVSKKKAA